MSGTFETAPSGRAKCRGCGQPIARGELRLGERLPNTYGDGEMTLWFHPLCAAFKRPEPLLEALAAADLPTADRDRLDAAARGAVAHPRLQRIDGAERAPTSQAKCRHCRAPIERDTWRIRVVHYDEGRFEAGGFIHVGCRVAYFETDGGRDAVLHFSAQMPEAEREALRSALAADARDAG